MPDDVQNEPVVKSGRNRQKPVPPEVAPGVKTAKYRCIRQRQHMGRVVYPDDIRPLPDPLPKGYEEYFERIGKSDDSGKKDDGEKKTE